MTKDMQIGVTVWGPLACFTAPHSRVERISLPVPTPSAARGILQSIYGKPAEFWWEINEIHVLKPIKYVTFMRNEVKACLHGTHPIDVNDHRTQRTTKMLTDVRYRIIATIHPRFKDPAKRKAIYEQAVRRISAGACFMQPSLGMRECECFFEPADYGEQPIPVTQYMGLMTYDTHVPYAHRQGGTPLSVSRYHCMMEDGIIHVPPYDSPEVIKLPEDPCREP